MKRTVCSISLVICIGAAFAEEAPKVELKHRSSFELEQGGRNPFWPIGWKPAPRITSAGAEHAGPAIPPSAFLLSSIALDPGAKFAIINGKAMSEGQQFGLQFGAQVYQVTVKAIEDGRVTLLHGGEQIVVPLRRK